MITIPTRAELIIHLAYEYSRIYNCNPIGAQTYAVIGKLVDVYYSEIESGFRWKYCQVIRALMESIQVLNTNTNTNMRQ
jgi:hypothetical protein